MKADGVFYEVLSEDRDGVSAFLVAIQNLGFVVENIAAPEKYYKNFNTRNWSYQVPFTATLLSPVTVCQLSPLKCFGLSLMGAIV